MRHCAHPRPFFASRKQRMLKKMANMRAAKERKRLANPQDHEPKFERWFPLELGLRDKVTGEVAWLDFKSIRDAARRLSVVTKFYS